MKRPVSTWDDEEEEEWMDSRPSKAKKSSTKKQPKERHTLSNVKSLGSNGPLQNAKKAKNEGIDFAIEEAKSLKKALQQTFKQAGKVDDVTISEFMAAPRAFKGYAMEHYLDDKQQIAFKHKSMTVPLDYHQLFGAAWMRTRENGKDKPLGGFLADAMGLGKTVMCLANIVDGLLMKGMKKSSTLIVVPSHLLLEQWYDEIHKFCIEKAIGDVFVYTPGSDPFSRPKNMMKKFAKHRIVLATYASIRKSYPSDMENSKPSSSEAPDEQLKWQEEFNEKAGPFHQFPWHRIILDEAQEIKNHTSLISRACRSLKAKHRWIVSGTPCQDKAEEMYSFFAFLQVPGIKGFARFKETFFTGGKNSASLGQAISKFLVRRSTTDTILGKTILPLPPATQETITLTLRPAERRMYDILLETIQKGAACEKNDEGGLKNRLLGLLLRLRQGTTHPLLIAPNICRKLQPQELEDLVREAAQIDEESLIVKMVQCLLQVAKMGKKPKNVLKQTWPSPSYGAHWIKSPNPMLYSTKTLAIVSQIRGWLDADRASGTDGGKIIIFTQFLDYIRLLERICELSGWKTKSFHGKMCGVTRANALKAWQDHVDIPILIATMKTGGSGLNLTVASRVIIVDLWWNKAVEKQAEARVFRRGQTRPTHFVRFEVAGTHDENILAMQKRKSDGIDGVMKGARDNRTNLVNDLFHLLNVNNVDREDFDTKEWDAEKDLLFTNRAQEDSDDEEDDGEDESSTESDSEPVNKSRRSKVNIEEQSDEDDGGGDTGQDDENEEEDVEGQSDDGQDDESNEEDFEMVFGTEDK